jgi:hypothetical protein
MMRPGHAGPEIHDRQAGVLLDLVSQFSSVTALAIDILVCLARRAFARRLVGLFARTDHRARV